MDDWLTAECAKDISDRRGVVLGERIGEKKCDSRTQCQ